MSKTQELTPELREAQGKAWSTPGPPPGKYIGTIIKGNMAYHYYKDGRNYYYENDFDIEMRKKVRERRRREK